MRGGMGGANLWADRHRGNTEATSTSFRIVQRVQDVARGQSGRHGHHERSASKVEDLVRAIPGGFESPWAHEIRAKDLRAPPMTLGDHALATRACLLARRRSKVESTCKLLHVCNRPGEWRAILRVYAAGKRRHTRFGCSPMGADKAFCELIDQRSFRGLQTQH